MSAFFMRAVKWVAQGFGLGGDAAAAHAAVPEADHAALLAALTVTSNFKALIAGTPKRAAKINPLAGQIAYAQRHNIPSARAKPARKSAHINRPKAVAAEKAVKRSPARKVVWLASTPMRPVVRDSAAVIELASRRPMTMAMRPVRAARIAA